MDERSLIEMARRGHLDAFNRLVTRHQELAFRVAYGICNDTDLAAHAAQDAFLRAFRSLDRYDGGSFKGWLLGFVADSCRRVEQRGLPGGKPAGGQDPGQDPVAAVGTLPLEQRIALVLNDVAGLRYREIAWATGTSLLAVKARIGRARASLCAHLVARRSRTFREPAHEPTVNG